MACLTMCIAERFNFLVDVMLGDPDSVLEFPVFPESSVITEGGGGSAGPSADAGKVVSTGGGVESPVGTLPFQCEHGIDGMPPA